MTNDSYQPARGNKDLEPIGERPRIAEAIASQLRQRILAEEFRPGERIPLERTAEQLRVSIMPVREALIILEKEGLVTSLPRQGFRANPVDAAGLRDIYELQGYIASRLSERAAETISEEELSELRAIHAEFEALATGADFSEVGVRLHELNREFHRIIHRAGPGDRLRWFLRLTTNFVRADLYQAAPSLIRATLEEHPRIIEALARRDGPEARRLVEEHFRQGPHFITSDSSVSE